MYFVTISVNMAFKRDICILLLYFSSLMDIKRTVWLFDASNGSLFLSDFLQDSIRLSFAD